MRGGDEGSGAPGLVQRVMKRLDHWGYRGAV